MLFIARISHPLYLSGTWYYLYSDTVLYLRFDNFTFSNL